MLPHRSLVISHREELVFQAFERLRSFGIQAEIEMADMRAGVDGFALAPVVVSTVQTQCAGGSGGRMQLFNPDSFGLVVVDEGHHATAESYKRILAHYRKNPLLKVLGVTATPDRADEAALGQIFESVAFEYEICEAIENGWLVPITQKMVVIEGLDFSSVRTTAGDLNGGDLAAIMEDEKNMQGIASATQEVCAGKRTLIFTASVRQSEQLCEILNRHRDGSASWICGETPKEERREILKNFADGRSQYLVNCAVLTEGFDSVGIECVVLARPTKSRALYCQMIGRGTRPLSGVVDGPPTSEDRRAAIAASGKPSVLILDFVGNAGRHKLISTADILGGKFPEDVIERAKKRAENGETVTMAQALEEELEKKRIEEEERKKREAARRSHLIGKASFKMVSNNPFDILELRQPSGHWFDGKKLSEKQEKLLLKQGIDPSSMSYAQANTLIKEMFRRWNGELATMKQVKLLKKHGNENATQCTMKEASLLIDDRAKNNWHSPAGWGKVVANG